MRKNAALITLGYFLFLLALAAGLDLAAGYLFIPGEMTVRAKNDYFHHGLRPNRKAMVTWHRNGNEYLMATNSLGFRDRERREVPLNPDRHRIVLIGDSFTEGVGLPYEETFTGILAAREAGKNIEVLNVGVVSYSPKLEYLKIRHWIEKGLRFDELYVFIDITDVQDELEYRRFTPAAGLPGGFWREAGRKAVNDFLLPRSYVFRKLYPDTSHLLARGEATAKWTTDPDKFNRWGKAGLALAEEYMGKLAELCREKGIRLTVAVYPWPEQIREKDLDSIQVKAWKEFCAERNCAFINLFPDFINRDSDKILRDYFFAGDPHWNKLGHEYAADKIESRMGQSAERP